MSSVTGAKLSALTASLMLSMGGTALMADAVNSEQLSNQLLNHAPAAQMESDLRFSAKSVEDNLFSSEPATYIIRLAEPPVAMYRGGVEEYEATSPMVTGAKRFDASTPSAQAYRQHLYSQQDALLDDIRRATGHRLDPERRWQLGVNGFAVELDPETAKRVYSLPGVAHMKRQVERVPLTFQGPEYIGAPDIWDGVTTPSNVESKGEGIVVGIIDSGINPTHESFAEVAPGDGYTHTNPLGSGNFLGVCDPGNPDHDPDYACNDKLIGAYDYTGSGADDGNGHGTHVAGTAAGNELTSPAGVEISGVAPRANVINYRVCDGGCPFGVDAVEDILEEGVVDVANYSIGPTAGGGDPYDEATAQAFLSLNEAGVLLVAAGGNSGPGANTISNFGPWNLTVASNNHGGALAHPVSVTGSDTPDPALEDMPGLPAAGIDIDQDFSGDLVYAGDVGDEEACSALDPDSMDGAIGVTWRGSCAFADKAANIMDAGAVAMIVANNEVGAPIVMGGIEVDLPSVMISQGNGDALVTWIEEDSAPTGLIEESVFVTTLDNEHVMAASSSRGPGNDPYGDLPGPDVVAPGASVYAAWVGGDQEYATIGGTSMASPHTAGGVALMMALYDSWTPQEIMSAIMMSANPDPVLKEDGSTPANTFDRGNGLVTLGAAADAGLVMDETRENFDAANIYTGSLPLTALNVPFLSNANCEDSCSWTRTVKAVKDGSWDVHAISGGDMTLTAEPSNFSLQVGEEQEITVTASDLPTDGSWVFGELHLEATGAGSDARLPVQVSYGEVNVALLSLATDLDDVFAITESDELSDSVWVGSGAGIVELDASFEATGTVVDPDWVEDDETIGNLFYSHGAGSYFHVVSGEESCIVGWDEDGATGERICPDWDADITAVAEDRRTGTWWAGTEAGVLYHYDPQAGEVVESFDLGNPIDSLYMAAGSGYLLILWDDADTDVVVFAPSYGGWVDTIALRGSDGSELFTDGIGDLTQTCNGIVWVSDASDGRVHAFDMGLRGMCPEGVLDLSNVEVLGSPDGGETALELGFVGPAGGIDSYGWALGYQTLSDAWLDEFRMEIISPAGDVVRLGGGAGSWGAPDEEELDYDLGWPAAAGYRTSFEDGLEDFAEQSSQGIWTVRVWGTYMTVPHGELVSGSHVNFQPLPDAKLTSLDVDTASTTATATLGVLTGGTDTGVAILVGQDENSLRPSGHTTVTASDEEVTVQIQATRLSCETDYIIRGRAKNLTDVADTIDGTFQTGECQEDEADAADGSDDDNSFFACSMGNDRAAFDPLMPTLFLLALLGLAARRRV